MVKENLPDSLTDRFTNNGEWGTAHPCRPPNAQIREAIEGGGSRAPGHYSPGSSPAAPGPYRKGPGQSPQVACRLSGPCGSRTAPGAGRGPRRARGVPFPTPRRLQSQSVRAAPRNPQAGWGTQSPRTLSQNRAAAAACRRELPAEARAGRARGHVRRCPRRAPVCPAACAASGPRAGGLSEAAATRSLLPGWVPAAEPSAQRATGPVTAPRARLLVPGGCVRRRGKLLLVAGARCTGATSPKFAPKVQPGDLGVGRGRVGRATRPPGAGCAATRLLPLGRGGSPVARTRQESRTGKSLRREGRESEAGGFGTR